MKINQLIRNPALEDKDKVFCRELMAEALIRTKKHAEAVLILVELEREQKSTWRTDILWGEYYERLQNNEKAGIYFEKAVTSSGMHPAAVFESVAFFGRTGQFPKIVEILRPLLDTVMPIREVCKIDIYKNLIRAFFETHNYWDAVTFSQRAISEGVSDRYVLTMMAESYTKLKRYADAKDVCDRLYSENPNDVSAILHQGIAYARLGNIEESTRLFELAESFPELERDSDYFINYSKLTLLKGDIDSARKYATRAKDIEINNPLSPAHAFYVIQSMLCGDLEHALPYMADFHAAYPRQEWVRSVKASEMDEEGKEYLTEEFSNMLKGIEAGFVAGLRE